MLKVDVSEEWLTHVKVSAVMLAADYVRGTDRYITPADFQNVAENIMDVLRKWHSRGGLRYYDYVSGYPPLLVERCRLLDVLRKRSDAAVLVLNTKECK